MEEETHPKWEGETSIELKGPTTQEVWGFLEDFCNIHKWNSNIYTCYQVEGIHGQPGLIRYCASSISTTTSSSSTRWAKEKLIMIDPIKRCLSYEVIDSNMGFKSYVGTMQVLPIINGRDEKHGCKIKRPFVCDHVEGWNYEDLLSHIKSTLHLMAKKMEDHVHEEQEYSQRAKWDGKVSKRLAKATVDQIWPLFKDFFNFHKWFPGLASCSGIYGNNSEPGCIRYSSGYSIQPHTKKQPDNWAKERLTAVDDSGHSLSYEVVDCNLEKFLDPDVRMDSVRTKHVPCMCHLS